MNRLLLLLSLCLAWLIPSPASASGAIHIYVGAPGRNKVPIALPSPVSDHPKAAEFYSVVQRDLVLSGWFEVIEEAAYVEPKGTGIRPGQFNFDGQMMIVFETKDFVISMRSCESWALHQRARNGVFEGQRAKWQVKMKIRRESGQRFGRTRYIRRFERFPGKRARFRFRETPY